ncbi:major facilitator superfamily domain-containing protein [Apiosordaria backusii]|uniref:Major facilitator superfamily domain-containing protein n=1 Tax=Apiosordaria backusii TaxID=314023 RepID=A0AA40E3B9_9PEZI|nr:major facilitator superfamily domain-containing protein [Apiosordaria backusii]
MATQTQTLTIAPSAPIPDIALNNEPITISPSPAPVPQDASPAVSSMSKRDITLLLTPLCLSVLLSSLDLTILTPSIPSIVSDFASPQGYIWIGSSFILAHTASTPIWGAVSDIFGRKPIMLLSQAIFFFASLLCALAENMHSLIIGRAWQGVGASGMGMMVNVIICDSFSMRDRGLYLAVTSGVWALGSAIGPVIGGVMSTRLSWRWCFWINLPIGFIVFLTILIFLPLPSPPKTPILTGLKALDWSGSLLIIGGALMILLALDFGNVVLAWSSPTVINLLVFGILTLILFFFNEWKLAPNPIFPARLFPNLSTIAAYGVFAFNSFVFIGLAYYLPLYSQSVLGANALVSGVHLVPLIVSCSLSAAFAGVTIQKTGRYLPVMYAAQVFLMLGVGLFVSLDFEERENLGKLFGYEILAGVGVGMNIEGPILAAQAAASELDTAAVIGAMGFARSMATAVSVVVGGVIFQNGMDGRNGELVQTLGEELAKRFGGGEAAGSIEWIALLDREHQQVVRAAYFESLRMVWIMYVAFAGFATLLTLLVRGRKLNEEHKAVVLGVERGRRTQQQPQVEMEFVTEARSAEGRASEIRQRNVGDCH